MPRSDRFSGVNFYYKLDVLLNVLLVVKILAALHDEFVIQIGQVSSSYMFPVLRNLYLNPNEV
jgi:hypothetical protein